MQQLELALLGAIPALIAMVIVDRMDAKRPEPRSTLRRVALAGAFSALPVILVSELLKLAGPTTGWLAITYFSFVVAALPEEMAKVGSMFLMAWRRPEFDERIDGIIYGAHAGLGFALVENVAYLALLPHGLGEYLTMFIGRAVLAVPGHAIWGGVAGYFAARRRFDGRGPGWWGGVVIAVLMHGLYDTWVFGMPFAAQARYGFILAMGDALVPVLYGGCALMIVGGGLLLRSLARRALADDDADGALIRNWRPPHAHDPNHR